MIKLILSLIANNATTKDWQLQIGAYLIEKGCGYQIGQIVREKALGRQDKKLARVKVVDNLFYDFKKREVRHLKSNRIIDPKDVTKITK